MGLNHLARRALPRAGVAAVAAVAVLVATPSAATAAPSASVATSTAASATSSGSTDTPDDKIDPALEAAVDAGHEKTFFVKLKDTADLTSARKARKHADKAKAAYAGLRANAAVSQRSLQATLDQEKVGYTSYWIANTVKITSDDPALLDQLAARSDVEAIVPERHYALDEGETEGATDAGTTAAAEVAPEWGIADVGADQVWSQYGDTGQGIVIANIDSGVQYDHPALVDNYRGNNGNGTFTNDYNWYDPTGQCAAKNGYPCDNNGHGTHTMGTMVGQGGIGMAPGAKWIAAKGCESDKCSDSYLLAAGQWILAPTDHNGQNPRPDLAPDIVNNSWGGDDTTFYQDIVEAWNAAGIFEAFAAGNDGDGTTCSTSHAPGSQAPSYGVGAYDVNGKIASFSGFGPSLVDGSMKPNIAAPGVDVRSSWINSTYRAINGTSMATPHVAGAVALLWAEAPSLIGNITATRALLNSTARNVDDTHCGGTADVNNVWGEGKLDILAAVDAAPHTAAIVTGTVTDSATGAALASMSVHAVGGVTDRTVTTDATGHYRITVPAGTYTITVSGYGYTTHIETGFVVETGKDATQDIALTAVARHAVRGTVRDVAGKVLPGATVTVPGTPVPSVTTDSAGRFTLPDVAEGAFTLTVSPAEPIRCNGTSSAALTVDGEETVNVALPARTDAYGNRCTPARYSWIDGKKKVLLSGDEDMATVALPFPVGLYGVAYTSVNVSTNGLLNFLEPRLGDYTNTALPTTAKPNGIVAAFWDDLILDAKSSVQTTISGKPGNRQFAIVWNDAKLADSQGRVSFEVVFDEATSEMTLQYKSIGGGAEQGTSATIGIENQAGTDALQYSFAQSVLTSGTAIRITPKTATPATAAADADMMVLTQAQADDLSSRLQLDPYGDVAQRTADPKATGQGATPNSAGLGSTGSNPTAATGSAAGGSTQLDALPKVTTTITGAVEGAQGMAVTVPVTDPAGDYFTLHGLGNITRRGADGTVKWERTNTSYYQEWNLPRLSPRYSEEPYPARIVMGFNAAGPFTPASDNGYATGDLTGDGVPDLAFTAEVGAYPFRPFVKAGYPLPTGTFVTVLDGATGKTRWTNVYPGVYNIAVVDGTLVLADSPTFNLNAPATSKVTLTGLRFSYADGALTPTTTWTFDTGKTKADAAGWASLEQVGDNTLAASWNLRKNSATAVPSGQTVVLNTANGSVRWQNSTGDRLYSRQLHLDASRDRLIGLEQGDVNEGVRYEIAAYNLTTGSRTTLQSRINALPIDLEVADLRRDAKAEYTVSEDTLDPDVFINANTVRALDGTTGAVLWSRTVKRDPAWSRDGATAWGLHAVDGTVVANYTDDQDADNGDNRSITRYARLAALNGKDGTVEWERRGVVASQSWTQPYQVKRDWFLRTVDTDQNIRIYDLAKGKQQAVTPIQSVLSSGVLVDVNGDGRKDVVAGGQSQGLYAYDGASMLAGTPKLLWQTTVPGQIHKIVLADVNGDGRDELVVAADTAAAVVDYRKGKVLTKIDGAGQYVWTVTAGDLDGDGKAEIVIPTDAVRAYRGTGGSMWTYAAPAAAGRVIFGEASIADGHVYAEYTNRNGNPTQPRPAGGVALDAKGKVAWSVDPAPQGAVGPVTGIPMRGATFASPGIPYADGHAVVYTWFAPQPFNNTTTITTFVEIRDGRTGALLHTGTAGGPWTLGNWFTAPEGLYLAGTASVRLYGPEGVDYRATTTAQIENAQLVTGPGGTRYLLGSGGAGFQLSDPAAVTTGALPSLYSRNLLGNREMLAGDLDGDGKDEIISLNFDDAGTDRTVGLQGGGYSVPYTAIRSLSVLTLDAA